MYIFNFITLLKKINHKKPKTKYLLKIKNYILPKSVRKVKVKTPAKIILAGDHSCVHHYPTLSVAVNKYLKITISKNKSKGKKIGKRFYKETTIIKQNGRTKTYNARTLQCSSKDGNAVLLEIIKKYHRIVRKHLSPFVIKLDSKIPASGGFGSSAALCCGILVGFNKFYGIKMNKKQLVKTAIQLEQITHGEGETSGIDTSPVLLGGMVKVSNSNVSNIKQQKPIKAIYVINTGKPSFTTKEVVSNVGRAFGKTNKIWKNFEVVFYKLLRDLQNGRRLDKNIEKHEDLLESIGVVPYNIQQFIRELRNKNIYAKVCGAGSICERDSKCGVVAVFHKLNFIQKLKLRSLCRKYGFQVIKVKTIKRGARGRNALFGVF